ncbi:hypothetical protein FACS189451_04560 [Bacteroidia bacterium]|nr:hypothetical protein FACS189451_04560 [Bacteroidia bacterium]
MNKLKVKIPTKKISTYLRDFSIVVVGIAVTLWVQSWLTSRSQKNDTALYLTALKLEMERNCMILDSVLIPTMEKTMKYTRYISMHDKNQLNQDTIRSYIYVYQNIRDISFLSSAFEMFKTSGNMRFVANKDLLQSIWSIYSGISGFEKWINKYYQDKWEELKKEILLETEGKPVAIPMYDFYRITSQEDGIDDNILHNSKIYSNQLKEIISEIDKSMQ